MKHFAIILLLFLVFKGCESFCLDYEKLYCADKNEFSFQSVFSNVSLKDQAEKINQWMADQSLNFSSISATYDESSDKLRLKALSEIVANDTIFVIHTNHTLNPISLNDEYFQTKLPKIYQPLRGINHETIGGLGLLIIHLYVHLKNIEISNLSPYLKTLPPKITAFYIRMDNTSEAMVLPFVWPDQELYEIVKEFRENLIQHYNALNEYLRVNFNEKNLAEIFGEKKGLRLYDYLWLRNIIEAKSWTIQGSKFLVPLTDYYIHIPTLKPKNLEFFEYEAGEDFLNYHKYIKEIGAMAYSSNNFTENDIIGTSFGDNKNWVYLLLHGFVPNTNTEECVKIEVFNDYTMQKFTKTHAKILERLGFRNFRIRRVCVSMSNGYISKFELILNIMNMSEDEILSSSCNEVFEKMETLTNNKLIAELHKACKAKIYKELILRPIYNQFTKYLKFYSTLIKEIDLTLNTLAIEISEGKEDLTLLKRYFEEEQKFTKDLFDHFKKEFFSKINDDEDLQTC